MFCQHGEAFIDPGFLIFILVPVDHMLEFVCHGSVDVRIIQRHVIRTEQEHFMSVGEGVGVRVQLVCRREVACQGITQAASIEYVEAGITIHTRIPLLSKELPVGWDDLLVKGAGKAIQIRLIEPHTIFDPEIDVVSYILECGTDLKIFICVCVRNPEIFLCANIVRRVFVDQGIRNARFATQSAYQVDGIIDRYDIFVEDLECFVSFCELIGFKVDRTGINGDLGCGLSIPGLDPWFCDGEIRWFCVGRNVGNENTSSSQTKTTKAKNQQYQDDRDDRNGLIGIHESSNFLVVFLPG